MNALTLIAAAFGLGLIFNAAPGPVFAETVRRGIHGGFWPALAVQIGSLSGDAMWAVAGLAGVGLLAQSASLRGPLGVAGAVYLLWLAWEAWQAGSRRFAVDATGAKRDRRQALRSGVLLSLTNPQNVAYWAALGGALGALGVRQPRVIDYGAFFAGFMLASLLWAILCAALVDRIIGRAGVRWSHLTYRACAIAFVALALSSLRGALRLM